MKNISEQPPFLPHLGVFYIRQLWWNVGNKYYALACGSSYRRLLCGGSCLYLNSVVGHGYWDTGASNKYTPDAFWWNNGQRDYARVGGNTYDGLRCGGSVLDLKYTAGHWDWNIGASNKYTPDAFWWNLGNKKYAVISGGPSVGLQCGCSFLYLDNSASYGNWAFGTSNKYTPDRYWHYEDSLFYLNCGARTGNPLGTGMCAVQIGQPTHVRDWKIGASNKYTPDVLWSGTNLLGYPLVGGRLQDRDQGAFMLDLKQVRNHTSWGHGASNKYTPDGFIFVNTGNFYGRVGCRTGWYKFLCGMAAIDVNDRANHGSVDFGASNKYTPDGFAFESTTSIHYPLFGGDTNYKPQTLIGMFACHLTQWTGFKSWSVGAFNKYTPDGLWWYLTARGYARSGGRTSQEFQCGSFDLSPRDAPGYKDWHIGTSNKYTPDRFYASTYDDRYVRVGGFSGEQDKAGLSCIDVSRSMWEATWTFGASLQMESGGILFIIITPLPVVRLTLGFCAVVPAWIWVVLPIIGHGILVHPINTPQICSHGQDQDTQ